MRHAALAGQFLERRQRRAAARRQVHVGEPGVDRGEGVEAARRQGRRSRRGRAPAAAVRATGARRPARTAARWRRRSRPRPGRACARPGTPAGRSGSASMASRGVRGLAHVGPVGERRDRGVRPVHDAGPDVRSTTLPGRRRTPRCVRSSNTFDRPCSSRTRREERRLPDVVPADDERRRLVEVEPANWGRAVTRPVVGGQPAGEGGQARGRSCWRRRRTHRSTTSRRAAGP